MRDSRPEQARAPASPDPQPAPVSAAPCFEDTGGDLAFFPWEAFRPRLRVPSRTVWTYWELGADFGAHPDDGRRQLFREILKHLQWPGGSFTFWPLTFEHQGGLKAQPGQFWRGVREARAGMVACFGERAFKALFPREPFGSAPVRRGNVVVLPLPGPGAMLAGDREAKRQVWQALRSLRF